MDIARSIGGPDRRGRVTVTLATGIPESVVRRRASLDHLDPAPADPRDADPGTMVVPQAGEIRFRLHREDT